MFGSMAIPRRALRCHTSEKGFLPEEDYFSLILDQGEDEIVRKDYSRFEWEKLILQELPIHIAYWKGRIPKKKEDLQEKKQNQIEKAVSFFDQIKNETEHDQKLVYILALFLARNKRLAFRKEVVKEGEICFLYEHVAGKNAYLVRVFSLNTEEITALQEEIAQLLSPVP